MSRLIIDNCIIREDIKAILSELKKTLINGKLKDIRYDGDNVRVTCPNHEHKNGHESTPSCDIYVGDSDKVVWGTSHCFSCGFKAQLYDFIAEAADKSAAWARKWLKENFTETELESGSLIIDDPIILNKKTSSNNKLKESDLDAFQSWHPYLQKRKLSREVCKRYQVKYDPKTECIVFPVRDIKGKLSFLTRRSVNSKKFIIDKEADKDVYLLYDAIKNKSREVYVCESQINALTLESWGYKAVALFGTGSENQYNILKTSGILKYNLCFDGDSAGKSGITRFIKNMNNVFITIIDIPINKDVNDLTKEEFDKLPRLEYK